MKSVPFAAIIAFLTFYAPSRDPSPGHLLPSWSDTGIVHVLDGRINEWPAQKFDTSYTTDIRYAVDNDTGYLYLAVVIPDARLQTKIMRQGMELYIDLKGKKKDGKGLEFPVKKEEHAETGLVVDHVSDNPQEQESEQEKKEKIKTMRAEMILNLTTMKVFGFAGDKADEQGLVMPGSANIAFAWDSTNAMCIEYKLPLSLLNDSSPLEQKEISIGWQLNGVQPESGNSAARSSGGRGHGGKKNTEGVSFGDPVRKPVKDFENMNKNQSFWTKYTFK